MQAENVSKTPLGRGTPSGGGAEREALIVPIEVEAAARVLAERFEPDELYRAMVDAARERAR